MVTEDRFTVACPCCGALLDIHRTSGTVVAHRPPPKRSEEGPTFEERLAALEEEKARAEALFRESVRTEKARKQVLEEKFKELVKKAEDEGLEGSPELRDLDLD